MNNLDFGPNDLDIDTDVTDRHLLNNFSWKTRNVEMFFYTSGHGAVKKERKRFLIVLTISHREQFTRRTVRFMNLENVASLATQNVINYVCFLLYITAYKSTCEC